MKKILIILTLIIFGCSSKEIQIKSHTGQILTPDIHDQYEPPMDTIWSITIHDNSK